MLVNMKDILSVARKHHFAVPAFNVSNTMLLIGVMEACEEASSPVILAIHPDELAFVRPSFIKAALHEAHNASVPVCIHLDHGSNMTQIMEAIQCGFTSVMMDASLDPLEENIAKTKQVVDIAHTVNVSVEGELGTIGSVGPDAEAGADEIIYVDPDDVEKFIDETGVDTLAVAIGTSHGLYPKDKEPKLRIDLLREITARVETPLVLHGGSGNADEEIAEAVTLGVCKINISSDTKSAFYKKAREFLANPDRYEPLTFYPACIEAMKEVAHHKIQLFNAKGKAALY